MADDAMAKRGKGLEEEYFHRKEKELLEKLRKKREAEAQMKDLAEASGIPSEDILKTLQELGYTRDTVSLLHLVPLISVAWADNKVSGPEREMILEAAQLHGVAKEGAAYQQLSEWLTQRPSDEFLEQTLRVIADLAGTDRPDTTKIDREKLLELSTRVAAASGGLLGLGSKISAEEQALLDRLATQLGR
jgi:hypothetical protein